MCVIVIFFCIFRCRIVYDIHDVIEITVFDEDKRGAPEFLGRVRIPLLSVSDFACTPVTVICQWCEIISLKPSHLYLNK